MNHLPLDLKARIELYLPYNQILKEYSRDFWFQKAALDLNLSVGDLEFRRIWNLPVMPYGGKLPYELTPIVQYGRTLTYYEQYTTITPIFVEATNYVKGLILNNNLTDLRKYNPKSLKPELSELAVDLNLPDFVEALMEKDCYSLEAILYFLLIDRDIPENVTQSELFNQAVHIFGDIWSHTFNAEIFRNYSTRYSVGKVLTLVYGWKVALEVETSLGGNMFFFKKAIIYILVLQGKNDVIFNHFANYIHLIPQLPDDLDIIYMAHAIAIGDNLEFLQHLIKNHPLGQIRKFFDLILEYCFFDSKVFKNYPNYQSSNSQFSPYQDLRVWQFIVDHGSNFVMDPKSPESVEIILRHQN